MSEQKKAEKTQNEINALVAQARALLSEKVQGALAALESVEKTLSEAQALAKQYNRTEAETLLLSEDFYLQSNDLPALKHHLGQVTIIAGPNTPQPGVRVRLGENVTYLDFPRGGVAVVSPKEAKRLIQQSPSCTYLE